MAPHSGAGGGGHSSFLQKRLAKGQKFFDSGDYQMAKQVTSFSPYLSRKVLREVFFQKPRLPGRPNFAVPIMSDPPTGEEIPTPETISARKMSIIQVTCHPLTQTSKALSNTRKSFVKVSVMLRY